MGNHYLVISHYVYAVSIMPELLTESPTKLNSLDENSTDEEFDEILAGGGKYTPLDVGDAVDILNVFHPLIKSGELNLYKWQRETLKFLCYNGFQRDFPLRFLLPAANGSGKDAYITSPLAIWHAASKIRSRFIVTSSSFKQLKNQTEPGIRIIAQAINDFFGQRFFLIKNMHVVCTQTGSEILLFVTDDPDLVEGWHPFPDYKDAEMAIVINEAKSVVDPIFDAFKRCNGYNRWIEISSPGRTGGHFYNMWRRCVQWPEKYKPNTTRWYGRRVTAYECPHISRNVIEDDKLILGESSSLFRSIYLAEFTDLGEQVIVTQEMIEKCLARNHEHISKFPTAGIDLSLGGDETTGYCINGNKILESFGFRGVTDAIKCAETVVGYLNSWRNSYGLKPEYVAADDGGVGRGILDIIRRSGWEVRRVCNQSAAINKTQFLNRGCELYHNVRRLCEIGMLNFDEVRDAALLDQLKSRRYKQHATLGKLVLETKADAKADGRGSPDRADAYVLAHSFFVPSDFIKAEEPEKKEDHKQGMRFKSTTEAHKYYEDSYANVELEDYKNHEKGRIFGSLMSRVGQLKHNSKV